MSDNGEFNWRRYPETENYLRELLQDMTRKNGLLRRMATDFREVADVDLFDVVDHFTMPRDEVFVDRLQTLGLRREMQYASFTVYAAPGTYLPRVLVDNPNGRLGTGAAVRVELLSDFLLTQGFAREMEGRPYSRLRRSHLTRDNDISVWAVERRSFGIFEPDYPDAAYLAKYFRAREMWETRSRQGHPVERLDQAIQLARQLVDGLGPDVAAHLVLEAERKYWQNRNQAAQRQRIRQERLGIGWANHDHHTFRCTRQWLPKLVTLMETLGFTRRERFYAGAEAGWGAQVMEHAGAGFTLFLDIDLSPEEVQGDFSRERLPELEQLGTIGLWCGLHGDSVLQAGLHHLAVRTDFRRASDHLPQRQVEVMDPFSDFDFLKQAFTRGETWVVDPRRIDTLLRLKRITPQQAEDFGTRGAVGSHLEIIQRADGFKGFNQQTVSDIIHRTDPRQA